MNRQTKHRSDKSHDNPAYEDHDKENEQERTKNDIHEDGIKVRNSITGSNADLNIYDQPIYMKRNESVASILHSSAPDLLIELDHLYQNPKTNTFCWIEKSRWIVYEEDYDIELKKFSNAHLSTLSVKGLKSFKTLFKNGNALFKCEIKNYIDVLNLYNKGLTESGVYNKEELKKIREAMIFNRFHTGMNLASVTNTTSEIHFNETKQCFEPNESYVPPTFRKRNISSITLSENVQRVQSQRKLSECLSTGSEGALIQVGTLVNIESTFSLFMKLDQPIFEDNLLDTYCPLRFIFIIFGPKSKEEELMEIGRVFGVMLSNKEFRESIYRAESKDDVVLASKKFVDNSALVHLNKRITPDLLVHGLPQLKYYANKAASDQFQKNLHNIDEEGKTSPINNREIDIENGPKLDFADKNSVVIPKQKIEEEENCSRKVTKAFKQFIPPFHQLYIDLKGNKDRYLSDFKEAFTAENASIIYPGIVFVYFVVLSPAITFGALFNLLVSPKMTITMLLVSSGLYQLLYVLLSGQPLEIIGVTPTVFVVEQVLATLTIEFKETLELLRFWIGVYVSILGFVFVMFNGAVIIQQFRRSVEEVYNTYFSSIFILSALFTMFKNLPYSYTPLNYTNVNVSVYATERDKFGIGGTTLFLAVIMLNFCLYLVAIKKGIYLRQSVRKLLGAFNVPLGIILVAALNYIFFTAYRMPTLNIPDSSQVNFSLWFNFPDFNLLTKLDSKSHGFCFLIAISMFFMLAVEVSTNSISVTKIERRLRKRSLYTINYVLMLVILPTVSAFLGWPFFSGAMVRSNAHCLSMAKWSTNNIPGFPKKVIGHCEQRMSGIIVGVLVFLSVFLGSILKYIPMASMYGMFLYMGVMGISDMILWKRIINLLQRRKHWKGHDYLKEFPVWNIRILVFIQVFFVWILIILYILSQFTKYVWTLFLFPLFIGIYAMIRGYVLPCWPRLNTHLSKMDKKHFVKLYDGKNVMIVYDDDIQNPASKKEIDDVDSTNSDNESGIY